jgi:hypothetical protein
MVITAKIINKYGNDHKTNNNFIIKYDKFYKLRRVETERSGKILGTQYGMIIFWIILFIFNFELPYYKK